MNNRAQHTGEPDSTATATLFDQAAKVFDGWTDPDTGARVLRL